MELFLVVIALYSVAALLFFGWRQRTPPPPIRRHRRLTSYKFRALTAQGRGPKFTVTAHDVNSAFATAHARAEEMKTDGDEILTVGLV